VCGDTGPTYREGELYLNRYTTCHYLHTLCEGVRVSAGVSGHSANFFAQLLKSELDPDCSWYVHNIYLQMFQECRDTTVLILIKRKQIK